MPGQIIIGVIGASEAKETELQAAFEVGKLIGAMNVAIVCGGMGGVMQEASRGCSQAGGTVIGLLPTGNKEDANPFITYAIPTNLGHSRNMVIAHSADILVAIGTGYGTLSEIAISLKLGKTVLGFRTWDVEGVRKCQNLSEIEAALGDYLRVHQKANS